jgi:hypothetical protein
VIISVRISVNLLALEAALSLGRPPAVGQSRSRKRARQPRASSNDSLLPRFAHYSMKLESG